MGRPDRKLDKKRRFLEAALEVIATEGVAAANSHSVTRRMKVSQPSFFYYFPTQAEFFRDLVNYTVEENRMLVKGLAREVPPKNHLEKLQGYIEGNFLWAAKYPAHVAVLASGLSQSTLDAAVGDSIRTALLGGEQTLYSLLTAGVAEGEFHLSLPPQTTAFLIHKQVLGGVLHIHHHPRRAETTAKMTEDVFSLSKRLVLP